MKKITCLVLLAIVILSCASSKYLTKTDDSYRITSDHFSWSMSFPEEGLKQEQEKIRPDGKAIYYMFTNKSTGLNASIFIEPAVDFDDPVPYRDKYWEGQKQRYSNAKNIRKTENENYAVIEYLVPEFYGVKLDQQHMNAMFVEDGYWIDVHLSKVGFKSEEKKFFDDFLNSIKFERKSNFTKYASAQDSIKQTTLLFFQKGSVAFLKADYKAAIKWYERTLDQERESSSLSREYLYVLIDNLGMSYGISGELNKAKETFEFGLSKDSEYPMFYYNLACTYAEMDNLDLCIENLNKAFLKKDNMIKGEVMPNPKTGTVTNNIGDTVNEIKKGKISFKVDKYGIIHNSLGRVSLKHAKSSLDKQSLHTYGCASDVGYQSLVY